MRRVKAVHVLSALACALLVAGPIAAQEEDEELGWSGSADLGLTVTDGNSETATLAIGLGALHEAIRTRFTFASTYLWSRDSGNTSANRLTSAAQLDYFPGGRFFLFGRLAVGFNKPAFLDLRLIPGAGLGYDLVKTDQVTFAIDAGGNVMSERFANDSTATDFFTSAGQRFAWQIAEGTTLTQLFQYVPKASDFANYRLHFELAFTTMFTERLGLRLAFIDDYNSRPFVDADGNAAEKNDLTFITGITVEF